MTFGEFSRERMRESVRLAREVGDVKQEAIGLAGLAVLQTPTDPDAAQASLREAERLVDERDLRTFFALGSAWIRADRLRGDHRSARRHAFAMVRKARSRPSAFMLGIAVAILLRFFYPLFILWTMGMVAATVWAFRASWALWLRLGIGVPLAAVSVLLLPLVVVGGLLRLRDRRVEAKVREAAARDP